MVVIIVLLIYNALLNRNKYHQQQITANKSNVGYQEFKEINADNTQSTTTINNIDNNKSLSFSSIALPFTEIGHNILSVFRSAAESDFYSRDQNLNGYVKNDNFPQIVKYKNLNTQEFKCPESHPYALDYKLVQPNESMISGRGYRNTCAFNSTHPFGDLLYGNEQSFNSSGKYENLTAYLPWRSSDTCQEDDFLIPLISSSELESIIAIRDVSSNELIGYQVESVSLQNKDEKCLSFCQNLRDTYCAKLPEDLYYCKNTVSRAYYRDSIYKRLNLSEKFCVCEFEGRVSDSEVFHFNQVVDIESVIDCSAKLEQVSCTNSLMLLNNQ